MKRFELALYAGSVAYAPGETVLVLLTEDERPPSGDAGQIDWRLQGEISEKLRSGYLSGVPGDAALVQARPPLCAKRLLMLGVGPSGSWYDAAGAMASALMQGAMQRLRAIHSRNVLLALPEPIDVEKRGPDLVRGLLQSLIQDESLPSFRLVIPNATKAAPVLERSMALMDRDAHAQGVELRVGWVTAPLDGAAVPLR